MPKNKFRNLKKGKRIDKFQPSLLRQIIGKVKQKNLENDISTNKNETLVDEKLSRKILFQARLQQKEIELEENFQDDLEKDDNNCNENEGLISVSLDPHEQLSDDNYEEDFYKSFKIQKSDEAALKAFMNSNPEKHVTLADLIMQKFEEKEAQNSTSNITCGVSSINPEIVEIFKTTGLLLSRYRSGKLPRSLKTIPCCSNWEELLYLTNPEGWSAAALYQATRLFVANLKSSMAQRFFNLVLYPRVRDDIAEYKRLNSHLYDALRKALFKPGAFIKGILLPLCESGTCTLREAVIIGSVIGRTSVPVLHAAAALWKIAELPYTGASSIFIRIFIDKKYALPYRVIDALVFHFLRAENDTRTYPVLWQQSFLSFVQRYKNDISDEQKDSLLRLIKRQFHSSISPEIERELNYSISKMEISI